MSKYYSYSVKDELIKYFPGDTIAEMRNHKEDRGENDFDHMVELAWAYTRQRNAPDFYGVGVSA